MTKVDTTLFATKLYFNLYFIFTYCFTDREDHCNEETYELVVNPEKWRAPRNNIQGPSINTGKGENYLGKTEGQLGNIDQHDCHYYTTVSPVAGSDPWNPTYENTSHMQIDADNDYSTLYDDYWRVKYGDTCESEIVENVLYEPLDCQTEKQTSSV